MKTLKALATLASLGLGMLLISGCNPEEPAKPVTPAPTPSPSAKAPVKPADTKGAAPAPISKDAPK